MSTWLWVIIGAVIGICLVFLCAYCCCATADEYEFETNQDAIAKNVFDRYDGQPAGINDTEAKEGDEQIAEMGAQVNSNLENDGKQPRTHSQINRMLYNQENPKVNEQ